MIIRTKKTWKELCDTNVDKHKGVDRRDFLQKGLATGLMTLYLPNFLSGKIIESAEAGSFFCPTPPQAKGAIAQIFAEGGPTMGARFISDKQQELLTSNPGIAANYGISGGANLVRLGNNLWIDKMSPFGATLLVGPRGWVGGQTAWRSQVLSKIAGAGHIGQFNGDDGIGKDKGLIGLSSGLRPSVMGKDISVGITSTLAKFAQGMPVAGVNTASVQNFAKTFTLTPAADGLISNTTLDLVSDATTKLSDAMALVFRNGSRKGAITIKNSSECAMYRNSPMANANYGNQLFTATGIADLNNVISNVAALPVAEQAYLAAYYQSAMGVAGGVFTEFPDRDYHDTDPLTNVAVKDVEEARNIVMFLAACAAAGARGAMIYTSNGQAIAGGVRNGPVSIEGVVENINAPVATADAGGTYNAGLMILYSPTGSLPETIMSGSLDINGAIAAVDPNAGSINDAMIGLYASAVAFINNGNIPLEAQSKFSVPLDTLRKLMVIKV